MKIKLTLILILVGFAAMAATPMTDARANHIADAIKKVENSKKYPYGIKSINTNGDEVKARRICINTVKNNYIRWQNAGSKGDYLDFLADRYCPPSADPVGNKNWKKNIHKLVDKGK